MDFTVKDLDWDAFDADGKRAISLYLVHVNKNGRFGEKYKKYIVKSYHSGFKREIESIRYFRVYDLDIILDLVENYQSKTLINVRDQFLEQLKFIKGGGSYANAEESNIQ